MNSNDIPRKSDLGREEIKTQSLGVLPREARTLLIMIDGKKTYQSYIDSLDKSEMFVEFGGVGPLFELLLDFQCIELIEQTGNSPSTPTPIASTQLNSASSDNQVNTSASNNQATQTQSSQLSSQPNNETQFAAEFTNASNNQLSGSNKKSNASYETIRSDLASYIEKNAPSQDAWGYLLSLEKCENAAQLLALVERIKNVPGGGNLSRGMEQYQNALK